MKSKLIFSLIIFIITQVSVFSQTNSEKENKRNFLINLIDTKTSLKYSSNTNNADNCRMNSLYDAENSYKKVVKLYNTLKPSLSVTIQEKFDLINNIYGQVAKTTSFQYLIDPSTITALAICEANIEIIVEELIK